MVAEESQVPGTIWEVYAPESLGGESPLGYRRSIAAASDGGRWIFEEFGERYPFEQAESYELPRKADRFTREMLVEYLNNFGLQPLADDFYLVTRTKPAVRLQQVTNTYSTPEFTLEEVLEGEPWKRHA